MTLQDALFSKVGIPKNELTISIYLSSNYENEGFQMSEARLVSEEGRASRFQSAPIAVQKTCCCLIHLPFKILRCL